MNDFDELTYTLESLDEGKKLVLTIESQVALSNNEYIVALEFYLNDLIRSVHQSDNRGSGLLN